MGQLLDEQTNNLKTLLGEDKRDNAQMDNFNILYYLELFNKQKRILSLLVVITALITFMLSVSRPRTYISAVTFLLPGSKVALSNLGSLLGMQDLSIGDTTSPLIHLMVESRRMAEGVAKQFNLKERYRLASFEQAVITAKGMVRPYNISTGMAIEAKTSDPKLSADIANFCADYLNVLNIELSLTTAKPLVRVLDPALPPSNPASRQTLQKILASSILVFVGGMVAVFFRDYLQRLKERHSS